MSCNECPWRLACLVLVGQQVMEDDIIKDDHDFDKCYQWQKIISGLFGIRVGDKDILELRRDEPLRAILVRREVDG